MDLAAFLHWLESTGLATRIRESLLLFPLLESMHVLGLSLVFGTIAVIDLRLLGVASGKRTFSRMASDILKWTWAAFAVTVATGSLMFITNAGVYFHNSYFRVKMLLLLLSGVNMMIFELTARKTIRHWDQHPSAPPFGKAAAALSLAMWIAIIFMGRLTGFTTSRANIAAPPPASVNFDDFLGGGAPPAAGPQNH